jgi:transcriptional regulator with XRE-family HTH domain
MNLPAHAVMQAASIAAVGEQLRAWRLRRRWSQLELAAAAEISTRHLSYIETGRANPSREMVLRLTERLAVPLRERNAFLIAAGYAPMYRERHLDDPALAAAKQAVELILKSHEPFPALAIDRHWNLVFANRMVPHLLAGVEASLLQAPMNVLRLTLHPRGLAPRIANLAQWRAHLFERLSRQIAATADPALVALLADLRTLPVPEGEPEEYLQGEHMGIAVPLRFRSRSGVLSFISTTTIFGSPVEVTLQELALETFLPLDEFTMRALQERASRAKTES